MRLWSMGVSSFIPASCFITEALDVIDNHDRAVGRADGKSALIDDCIAGQRLDNYDRGQHIINISTTIQRPG